MNRVFLDTVGLLAVWNKSDQWHSASVDAMKSLIDQNVDCYCSDSIFLECGNAAARTSVRDEVVRFRSLTVTSDLLLTPTDEELELAWSSYSSRSGAGAGIVDQISFVLMSRMEITEVFSNDEHFRAAGFVTLF